MRLPTAQDENDIGVPESSLDSSMTLDIESAPTAGAAGSDPTRMHVARSDPMHIHDDYQVLKLEAQIHALRQALLVEQASGHNRQQ